jgi:hypothetical protein
MFKYNTVTISAFRSDLTLDKNYDRHDELLNGLRNLGLKPEVVVSYCKANQHDKTSYELSCELNDVSWEQLKGIYSLAIKYEQDSILVGDITGGYQLTLVNKYHELHMTDTVYLGSDMIEVPEQEMQATGAGTVKGNRYYTIVK